MTDAYPPLRGGNVEYVEIDPAEAETVGWDYWDGTEMHHWCKECPHD